MEAADTISPSNIELEEKQNDGLAVNRDKKRTRFKSPIRHIFKPKKNDESSSYYRLQEEKQYSDLQFKEPSVKVPVYAISLAAGLFLVGTVMITLGALMLTGRIETQYSDRTWPLILIGSIIKQGQQRETQTERCVCELIVINAASRRGKVVVNISNKR
ncbi:unnamed protein product [Adineta ricciae]|uniref:Uncharacterized protein n=1 Tax=Adineta ricciae TaxID=249248 RepID=A0A813MN24_ADIRI|nr:unnamed protein product [Adineta ricciae]